MLDDVAPIAAFLSKGGTSASEGGLGVVVQRVALSDQMDGMFDSMVKKRLEVQDVTPEQRQAIEARRKAASDMVKELLSWDSMESLYLKVYEDTFTQEEIDGMIAFYSSLAGRATSVCS